MAGNEQLDGFTLEELEELTQYGYIVGRALAALVDGIERGKADMQAEIAAARAAAEAAEGTGDPARAAQQPVDDGESGGVCCKCWCNTCFMLDTCDAFPPSQDGKRPPPCAECHAKDCAPLMPTVRPAECGTYKRIPKDCAACWCHECAGFEECVVQKPGFDQSDLPCPCDGCRAGTRFMPKEEPPTCGRFLEKDSR